MDDNVEDGDNDNERNDTVIGVAGTDDDKEDDNNENRNNKWDPYLDDVNINDEKEEEVEGKNHGNSRVASSRKKIIPN